MRNQRLPIDLKLIPLGLSTKDRMIVDDKAILALISQLPKNQCGRQAADASTNNDAIVSLARIDYIRGKTLELSIANPMSGVHDSHRVPI